MVTLADGETVPVDGQYPSVYKYQATDNIMREVMACYCVGAIQPALTAIGNVGDIIGVYSPVNRCLKTSFALTAGQLLSRKSRVLYVNLEDCSGLEKLFGEEHKADCPTCCIFTDREITAGSGLARLSTPGGIWITYRRCGIRRICARLRPRIWQIC